MKISPKILAPLVAFVYRIWMKTVRCEQINREHMEIPLAEGKLVVICLWHDEFFPALAMAGKVKAGALISRSRDGELLARVIQKFGFFTLRGSSSRGGLLGLHGAVTIMRKQRMMLCVTVDGPRGPRHQVKDGVFFMAKHVPALLCPVRMLFSKRIMLNSWDKFQIPLPFSKMKLIFGDSYALDSLDLTGDELARQRQILAQRLGELEEGHASK